MQQALLVEFGAGGAGSATEARSSEVRPAGIRPDRILGGATLSACEKATDAPDTDCSDIALKIRNVSKYSYLG